MKTEEATCKVAPSPTQISYPLYNVKDGVIEDSPHTGVTCSPCSIESPQTQKLYITPVVEGRKPKDPRFACLGYIQKLKGIPSTAKSILTYFVMVRQWRPDRLIIIGFDEVAEKLGLSRRQVIRLIKCLIENNCLRLMKKGGIKGGTKYEANSYALGSLFDNLPPEEPKRRAVTKMSPIKGSRSVTKMSIEQCQECHPLPIVPPIHTHTEELPSAFNKENWLTECQRLNPSRDLKDIDYTFHLAESEGAKDGDWMLFVRRYDRSYKPRSKAPTAPAVRSPTPRPAVKSSCESPSLPPLDLSNPQVLEHELYDALKNNNPTACIIAGLDPALVESATAKAEARLNESNASRYYRNTNRHNSGKLMKISEMEFEGMTKVKI